MSLQIPWALNRAYETNTTEKIEFKHPIKIKGKTSKDLGMGDANQRTQQRTRLDAAKTARGNRAVWSAFVVIPATIALIAITKR